MTDQEVHSAVVRWLSTNLSGVEVIKADQSERRPSLPYVMVRFAGSREIRTNAQEVEYSEDAPSARVMARPVIETEWQFSVHAFSDYPSDLLRPVRSAAKLAQVNEPLMPALVIHEVSQVRYIPEQVGERWEPRAQMDLFIWGLVKDGHLIDTIEEFTFSAQAV